MNVRIIDTSIMLNLLGVPGRCEKKEEIRREFCKTIERRDVLILPIATIIETGNAISQVGGSKRYDIAEIFTTYLLKTAERNAPWSCDYSEISDEDLRYFADNYLRYVNTKVGMGDLSIIRTFEKCRDNLPVDCIEIWSTDEHLCGYKAKEAYSVKRRKK